MKIKPLLILACTLFCAGAANAAQVTVNSVTGGDAGQGFTPLSNNIAAVDFDSHDPNQTVQGVSFTAGAPIAEGTPGGFGGFNGYGAPAFTPADANNTGMSAVFSGFYYVSTPQQSTIGGNEYAQYQFTNLTVGQTYQVDLFTIADANPRYTLTQVVGATTNSYDVLTGLTPTIVSYTAMTPDVNGGITVQYCEGLGGSGGSGLISAIAVTTDGPGGTLRQLFPQVIVPSLNTNEVVVAAATPQEYGAKGDGITDDSGAFQAAMSAVYNSGGNGGGVVYVPTGNYD